VWHDKDPSLRKGPARAPSTGLNFVAWWRLCMSEIFLNGKYNSIHVHVWSINMNIGKWLITIQNRIIISVLWYPLFFKKKLMKLIDNFNVITVDNITILFERYHCWWRADVKSFPKSPWFQSFLTSPHHLIECGHIWNARWKF
jgi:hypothetical protein